jgi:hypothetical protein
MKTTINLGSELLVDQSHVQSPHLRLLLAVVGKPLASGSSWIVVNRKVAALYGVPLPLLARIASASTAA